MRHLFPSLGYLTITSVVLACAGEQPAQSSATTASPSASAAGGGAQTPDAGRKIITIEMITDEKGNNRFSPSDFEAHRGDVLRFTLVTGVHNVHFLADSNPRAVTLPAAGALLQLPGQSVDIKVTWPAGRYYFQCDPHALLGMVGRLNVEDED